MMFYYVLKMESVNLLQLEGRGFRFGFENSEYYFKTQKEMKLLFSDIPDAIINISEIISKCSHYRLASEVLLPEFEIPEEFKDPLDLENNELKIEKIII